MRVRPQSQNSAHLAGEARNCSRATPAVPLERPRVGLGKRGEVTFAVEWETSPGASPTIDIDLTIDI